MDLLQVPIHRYGRLGRELFEFGQDKKQMQKKNTFVHLHTVLSHH